MCGACECACVCACVPTYPSNHHPVSELTKALCLTCGQRTRATVNLYVYVSAYNQLKWN